MIVETKKQKIKRRRQQGSALMLSMVMATLTALMIAVMQDSLLQRQRFTYDRDLKVEYRNILESLKNTLENESFCSRSNIGITNGDVFLSKGKMTNVSRPKALRFNYNGAKTTLTKGWTSPNGNLKIVDIRFQHVSNWQHSLRSHTFSDTPVTTRKARYNLIVDAMICKDTACSADKAVYLTNERKTKMVSGKAVYKNGERQFEAHKNPFAMDIALDIRFEAKKIASGAIMPLKPKARAVTCFGTSTGAAQCEDLGRIWNPFYSRTAYRCQPHDICLSKKPSGSNKCSAPYTRVPAGYDTSKKEFRYTCMWCNENV